MWIKIFYWMRLFSIYAYFVKLIQQTIQDVARFMLMVMIILISFGAFFYTANRNLKGTNATYLGAYFNNEVVDSVLSVYFFGALLNFDTSRFKVGYCHEAVMFMFLLATAIVNVVFMNMVISIMTDTYETCQ